MLIAYHPSVIDDLREPTAAESWRVLVSGCLASWPCGVDGSDYGLGARLSDLLALPTFRALPFCPEQDACGSQVISDGCRLVELPQRHPRA